MVVKWLLEVIEDVCWCRMVVDLLVCESVLGVDCEGILFGVEGFLMLV